jgi:hypothetical protein
MIPVRLFMILCLMVPVAGCTNVASFFADIADREVPLPGERKPVFPGGVPGVQQGVPQEYLRPADNPPAAEPQPAQPVR